MQMEFLPVTSFLRGASIARLSAAVVAGLSLAALPEVPAQGGPQGSVVTGELGDAKQPPAAAPSSPEKEASPAPGLPKPLESEETADEPASKNEQRLLKNLELFFGVLKIGDIPAAYGSLLRDSPIKDDSAVVDGLIEQTNKALETYGPVQGAEKIRVARAGDHLLQVTYFSYSPRHPMQWTFFCYSIGGPWQILDIDVHNDLGKMFKSAEEGGKLTPGKAAPAPAVPTPPPSETPAAASSGSPTVAPRG